MGKRSAEEALERRAHGTRKAVECAESGDLAGVLAALTPLGNAVGGYPLVAGEVPSSLPPDGGLLLDLVANCIDSQGGAAR